MEIGGANITGQDNVNRQLIRVGYVSSQEIDGTQVGGRVAYPDRQDLVSEPMPVLQKSTVGNQDYWSPQVGEQVLTVHLPNGAHKGFILGSIYSTSAPPPVTDPNKRHITFADGTVMEFDRASSVLFMDTKGPITLNTEGPVVIVSAGEMTLQASVLRLRASEIILEGNVTHIGNMESTGVHVDANGVHA
jgi:phage baseplate assembly protein V